MANNPTVVIGSLNDEELKKSIDKLVNHVDQQLNYMVSSTKVAVMSMNKSLKSLGDTKIDFGGSADGGASKRAKAQNAETAALEKSNQAAKEKIMTLDQEQATIQKTIDAQNKLFYARTMKIPTDQYDMQIAKLERIQAMLERYRRGEMSFSPSQVSGLEKEERTLLHLLGQVNTAQQQTTQSAQRYTEEIRRQAQAIRESKQWRETGTYSYQIGDATYYVSKKQGEIEAQLVRHKEQQVNYEKEYLTAGMAVESKTQQQLSTEERLNQVEQQRLATEREIAKARREYISPTTTTYAAPTTDMLRKFIASKAGVEVKDVKIFDETTASASKLQGALKQVQKAYSNMSAEERNSPFGQALIRRFQELQRESQKTQQQLSRPTSLKSVKGLDEKTLDDIAYKMQRLRAYRQGIDLTKPNAANEIKQVDEALAKLQKDADKWMSKSQQMIKSNTALGRSWNYMKNRLAFYVTVGAGTSFIKNLIEVRSQYEMNERALGILIDSAERGTQIFNELSQMALVSPYTLIELSTAAKQLTAYDVAAKDVVDTTRRLADMAAAVGIPIERLTYALGQIKAYGYLNSRDARMFANAGIPLVKQLSDYYTELEGRLVSTADVYDRIKKKAIDYNEVMEVINKMTDEGGKFFDFQAKMADTLKVRLANLTLAWNNMLNDMGKESQGVLTWGIGALREMFLHWKQLDSLIKNAAWALGIRTALMFIAYSALKAGAALGVTTKQMALSSVFGTRLAGVLKTVALSMKAIVTSPLTWWSLLAIAAVEAIQALFGVNEAQKALNESIRNGAKDNYDNISKFLEQYKEVRDSLYKTVTKPVPNGMLNVQEWTDSQGNKWHNVSREYTETLPQDIDKNEAKKAWEAVREQIELTVASSDKYIENLLSISNMSERVRQGFNLLDDIQVVNAALKELDDDTIKVSKDISAWWNAWPAPDGLIGNLKDLVDAENKLVEIYGSVEAAKQRGGQLYTDYEKRELANFRDDLQETTDSIINFIELKGWSKDESKINQVFEQITQKLVLDNQLDPQKAFTLQTEVEEARSKAAKEALLQRINDEKAAYKISHDESVREALNADIERYNNWNETNGRSKVEWERFTKWLKEQHISETTAMFRNMDAEDIKSLNFQEGKHAEWVTRMVTQYAKEHKMSYDEAFKYLKSWVTSANRWSVFIPLIISTENKKSVYDQLGEYDKAIDDADAQIARLTTRINELNAKKQKSKEETQELANAEQELADAQKAKADAEAKGGHGKKEKKDEKAANKAAKQAESELAKALKDELSTIDKVRSIYKDLTKEGMSHANAVERATRGWDETVNAINRVLQKNGLQKLDLSKFAGIENPRELVNMFQSQLNTLLKRGAKPAEIKELQTKVNSLEVDADKYDLTKITKGLNNELGKLKDEYELAVELDADPELGNAFANMMGIDIESLPHTVKEYADRYSTYLNKYLKGKNSSLQFTGDELRGLTRDDITAFREQVDAGSFNQEWFDAILKAYEDINGKRKKDLEETEKWKNSLIEKYGNLQDKLTKIYKDSVQNQVNAVKSFGTEDQKSDIVRLQLRIEATDNPAELTEINTEIAKIVKDVTDKNPIALKLVTASDNQTKADTSKAYWEDFKDSELYAMTFEDMANNSTRAIQLIMDKLEVLKDKVKEDPASMKALIKSLEDAQKELNTRDPFGGVARSLRDMANASKETMEAQKALWRAEVDVEQAQQEVDNAEDETPDEQAVAQQKLADAVQRRAAAQVKLTQAENKGKKAQENLKSSLQGIADQLGNVQGLFGIVSKLFRAGGDDETADAIDAINEGFTVMTQVIMGVMAAMVILESSNPWLLAIAAALSVIVGLVSFLIGNDDKKIVAQIEESQRAVKRLENTYKNLSHSAEEAYGAMVSGAKKAMQSNKELQLVELKRQLTLEKSRDSKHRDEDKIVDLEGQIIDLKNEIHDATQDIINDLLDISSAGDGIENLVSAMIEAFRNGEDAMEAFGKEWDKMIDNMILKLIVTQFMKQAWDTVMENLKKKQEEILNNPSQAVADAQKEVDRLSTMSDSEIAEEIARKNGTFDLWRWLQEGSEGVGVTNNMIENYKKAAQDALTTSTEVLNGQSLDYTKWSLDYMNHEGRDYMMQYAEMLKNSLGDWYTYGENNTKELSALQAGIKGITEEQASALEAYMNSVSQQVYLHSDLLTQIRDAVVGFDIDVQTASLSQILLQLQTNYIVMQSMHSMMEGWTTPSGQGIRVELIS